MMNRPQKELFERYKQPLAFILGIYPTSNLGAIRNLGRQKIPTVVLDAKRNHAAFYSKYTKGFVCPHPKFNEEQYIDFLILLGKQLPMKGVLIPTGDTETLALLRHRKQLEPHYHFTMADYDIVNTFINKKQFYHLLEQHDIPHPKTFFPSDEQEVRDTSKRLTYPCIVKPVYATYFRLHFNTKLFVASSPDELLSYYTKAHSKNNEVMLQEIIPGNATTMFGFNAYYDRSGVPHGGFSYQRIREWPIGFGNGCCIQHVREPQLEQITSSLVKEIGYYGIVDAEFKRDPRDGTFQFIEVNPRVWMQNSFPSRFGSNLPYIAYLDAIGLPIENPPNHLPDEKITWIYLLEDLQSARVSIRSKTLSLRAWILSYHMGNEYALFAWDDPLPFFVIGFQSIPIFFSSLFKEDG
ncbi:MAG TPA: hypothetical protein DSN98_01030 [Thermoplasmata archaeon]|jgi:D-aspartate ligase|nr:MAG TPA: hypothetical protein DSN98_01030 [Thermoplasmata archaeon]